jgi:hypothetical protein
MNEWDSALTAVNAFLGLMEGKLRRYTYWLISGSFDAGAPGVQAVDSELEAENVHKKKASGMQVLTR